MAFDNFVTGAIAHELNSVLSDGRIERIYQPEREEILLHVNVPPKDGHARARHDLLLSANSGHPLIYLTALRSGNPQNPPGFCMLLRKHLIGARVMGVSQVEKERILRIDLAASNELGIAQQRCLVIEIMGKHSNIILLDTSSDRIIDAIKRIGPDLSRVRQTLPGMPYRMPPPGKGISPIMAEETACGKDIQHYEALAAEGAYTPLIYFDGQGNMQDFHVFDLSIYGGLSRKYLSTVSEMLETWYETRDQDNRVKQKSSDLAQSINTKLDKLYLKKQRLSEDLAKAGRGDEERLKGELLTANIYRLDKGASEVSLARFDMPEQHVRIMLDPRLTPAQNAQRFFKRYSKAKTALVEKQKQLQITQSELDFLESYRVYIEHATNAAEVDELRTELAELGYISKRKQLLRPQTLRPDFLKFEIQSGLIVHVGRNNRENDALTLKHAKSTDLWLHTKDIPGSHVILSGDPEHRTATDIQEAAAIAAWYSKARQSESVPVDYCLVKYVKKPNGAKPGMVIFKHNRTVYVKPRLPEITNI